MAVWLGSHKYVILIDLPNTENYYLISKKMLHLKYTFNNSSILGGVAVDIVPWQNARCATGDQNHHGRLPRGDTSNLASAHGIPWQVPTGLVAYRGMLAHGVFKAHIYHALCHGKIYRTVIPPA